MRVLGDEFCEKSQSTVGFSSSGKRRLRGDLVVLYSFLSMGVRDVHLFSLEPSDGMHGNDRKLCQGRVKLDIRKHFFTERAIKHWSRLPEEVVTALSLSQCLRGI